MMNVKISSLNIKHNYVDSGRAGSINTFWEQPVYILSNVIIGLLISGCSQVHTCETDVV